MVLTELEILTANIILVTKQDTPVGISSDEIAPILKDVQFQVGSGPPGQQQVATLTSLREQTVIVLTGNRLIFQDQSGISPPKPRLAEIVSGFANLLRDRTHFIAYGFNFDIAFDSKDDAPAAEIVLGRFIRADRLAERGLDNLKGAGLRLYYDSSQAKCDLRIEPLENRRDAARFYAHINFHYELGDDDEIPDLATLRSDFAGKFQTFKDDLERLVIA